MDRVLGNLSMAVTKFEVDMFTGENSFSLWRIKIKSLLVHQGLTATISREELAAMFDTSKATSIQQKAHSVILLFLGNEVLREVSEETTAVKVWERLEALYLKRSLANRLYLKKRSYSLHIDEFNKVILDLENIDIKVEKEDQAILLLSYLPKVYDHFLETLLHGKQTLTMSKVKVSLNSKEMYMKSENKEVVNEHEEEQRKGIQETIEGSLA